MNITIKNSMVTDVRVYLQGAQITRKIKASIEAGENKLLISNLCSEIDNNSISVRANGAEVRSAVFSTTYQKDVFVSPKMAKLEEKMKAAKEELSATEDKIAVLNFEKELLTANRTLVGADVGVKIDDLKNASNYLKTTFEANRAELTKLNKIKDETEEEIEKLKLELKMCDRLKFVPAGEITIDIISKEEKEVELTINYYVKKAQWKPVYEIRGYDGLAKVGLKLKAEVKQATGEKWENVNLKLYLGNPNTKIEHPNLQTWFLKPISHAVPMMYSERGESQKLKAKSLKREMELLEEIELLKYEEARLLSESEDYYFDDTESTQAKVNENQQGIEFIINEPCVLQSDESKTFDIAVHELNADYKHFAICKQDKNVFLLAKIASWQKLNLISAPANVFFDNAYIGKTNIDPSKIKENFEISFGVDNGVIVDRVKVKDFSGKQVFGSNTKTTINYAFSVKNNKKTAIDIILVDQIPVSTDKSITVDAIDISGAKHNKDTGELVWSLGIKPAIETSKTLKYMVTYPSNMELEL